MNHNVLVVAELRGDALRQVSFEALAAARLLAGDTGTVTAFAVGAGLDRPVRQLLASGADRVVKVEDPLMEPADTERTFRAVADAIRHIQPSAIVLGHTAVGKDVAPRLAAALDCGQISDIIAIERDQETVRFTRPIYAGKAFEKRVFRERPWVVTIRPNNFRPLAESVLEDQAPSDSSDVTSLNPDMADLRTIVKDVVRRAAGKTDLSEAKVIVSGGRGVRSAEGFKPLAELAAVLNGAVGASRGACDAGYCDYSMQIGQTGKVVTPELYIACGISGAIQHLAGMSGSRVIVAVNKDPEAPIFKVADYGIVGDLFEIVPLLVEEFQRLSSAE